MQNFTDVKNSIEPWYLLMVVLGALNVAFNIMLIPQHIADTYPNGNALIGVIMAAWTAGPLMSPFLSKFIRLTDGPQYNVAKLFLLNALLAFTVPYCTHLALLFLNLFLQGLIYASVYSILNLLIVKRFQENQWHSRTSMLIAAFIIGEVIGFALAGLMADPIRGVSLGGVGLLVTSIFCLRILPEYQAGDDSTSQSQGRVAGQTKALLLSPFGLMVLGWALLCFSAQILFLPFPVLMEEVFLLPPVQSSMVISIAGLVALGFYPFIGTLTTRFGADSVLIGASTIKFLVFIVFSYCALNMGNALIPVVMLMIAVNRWTWPFMMTGSQIQASTLSKGRGNTLALTLFMAFSGAGNMLAGFANSYVTARLGIEYVPMFAAGACLLGILCVLGSKFCPFYLPTPPLPSQGIINEKG
ncbi:MFS transporter [Parasalinivibrio latis]|uniref:MFS transporter n=1 Tax=Parasalinivibrio latis TaxID=2952610 RepID=UPI0030E1F17F